MKDLKRFGTEDYPLHPSGLRPLLDCQWSKVVEYLYGSSDEGGPAGDTGSAVHAAAHALHDGKEVAESLKVMQDKLAQYPKADLADAAQLFLRYSSDPRNRQAKVILNEIAVKFQIAPAPEDETKEPIVFVGRLDQVREVGGCLKVYDLKSSKKDPTELLHEHTFQMAAYCVGASILLKKQVDPGALILVRQYKATNHESAAVFWHYPWTFQDCARILNIFRHRVAEIRAGILYHNPRESMCRWCSQRSPDLCLPKLNKELKMRESIPLDIIPQ